MKKTATQNADVTVLLWGVGSIVVRKSDVQFGVVTHVDQLIERASDGSRRIIRVEFRDGENCIYTMRCAHRDLIYISDDSVCEIIIFSQATE